MRPNLAFGPIDSIAQYLLYLSVVVLGVLLPLLLNKWRTRREEKRLLARTLAALADEVGANRRRVVKSHQSFVEVLAVLEQAHARYLERRTRLSDGAGEVGPEPREAGLGVNLALTTRVSWDVARHANALVLIGDEQLQRFTRAYQMQELFERDRNLLLELVMQLEVLDLPADLSRLEVVDERLALLTRGRTVLRYHVGLTQGMIDCYDEALGQEARGSAPGAPTPSAASDSAAPTASSAPAPAPSAA